MKERSKEKRNYHSEGKKGKLCVKERKLNKDLLNTLFYTVSIILSILQVQF